MLRELRKLLLIRLSKRLLKRSLMKPHLRRLLRRLPRKALKRTAPSMRPLKKTPPLRSAHTMSLRLKREMRIPLETVMRLKLKGKKTSPRRKMRLKTRSLMKRLLKTARRLYQ
jgi:hypothetical protein